MTTLDNLRKTAKRWLKALRDGDVDARVRLHRAYPAAPATPTLRDVQHALARERGYESWRAMTDALSTAGGTHEASLHALLVAAGRGDVSGVQAILDNHPDLIDERGSLGASGLRTALHFGVHHEPVVRLLLERGADPNIRDEGDNAMPLHFVAERENFPVIRLLVEHGADPVGTGDGHELDVIGWLTVFGKANRDIAEYLLSHGARHTLFSAVAMGEPDVIRQLTREGADINRQMDRTNLRRRPLHLAVIKKQPAALAALIDLGVELDAEDRAGLTALDQAALNGESEMADALLAAGATLRLPAAIGLQRFDQIEPLLREEPDAVKPGGKWGSLIVRAAAQSPGAVIESLIRAGASVHVEADEETAVDQARGYTALHEAAFYGNTDAVRVLLQHGANPRARDGKYCGTPAGWANHAGKTATRDVILEAGIDIFDAITFDRADRVSQILDADPDALGRPFGAYASCGSRVDQWWPVPDCTPLQWAVQRKKENAARVLSERGAAAATPIVSVADQAEELERTLLDVACWDHHAHGQGDYARRQSVAARLLHKHPDLPRRSLYTAIVCGLQDEVERILSAEPHLATEKGGTRGWEPLLYVCYGRVPIDAVAASSLAIARLLLDRGANPHASYMAGDAIYSALVGVAGEGEQDAPPHPCRDELYRLLLERGAGPYDIQVLYNTHFHGHVRWWLDLTYGHTVAMGRKSDWENPDWPMLDMGGYGSGARFLLRVAIDKNDAALAEWLLAHGANPNAAPPRGRGQSRRTLYEDAVRQGATDIAELLRRHGAVPTSQISEDEDTFVAACLRLDRDAMSAQLARHPEYLLSWRALHMAAERNRPDVVALLLDLGTSIEVQDSQGQRALHRAAGTGALDAARLLIARGADIDPEESNWRATPLGYALYGNHQQMVDLLSAHSRDVWHLPQTGNVERLRQVLRDNPSLASRATDEGITPLWLLPDDEDRALEAADVLIEQGANPAAVSKQGTTAAQRARSRGLDRVADRIDRAAAERGDGAPRPAPAAESLTSVEQHDHLARDLVVAHESGEPGALRRLSEHLGRPLTQQDVRSIVRAGVPAVRDSSGPVHYFDVNDARQLIARAAGHASWNTFVESAAQGVARPATAYRVDVPARSIRPQRVLSAQDWDEFVDAIAERRIVEVEAAGQMTDAVLARIAAFDHVLSLNLEGSRHVTDEGVRHLAQMPQVQRLNLTGCAITDRGLEVLRRLPQLRTFELYHHAAISDAGIAHLADCHLLERVALLGTRVGDAAFDAVAGKERLRFFQAGVLFSERGLARLHDIPAFTQWQGGEPRYALMEFEAGPTYLLLHPATPLRGDALKALAGLDGLFALNLDNPSWKGADLTPLARLAHLGWLGHDADDASMEQIAALPNLRFLMCQDTDAGDEGFTALSRSSTLEYIWGRRCYNLGSRGFRALARMPALKGLAASCRNVTDDALAALPSFPALREFMPMDVPDAGFRHVGACERLEALWCMYCRDTTDAATEQIAGLRRLTIYYAGQTRITDRSLDLLGRVDSLEGVRFWNCAGITDAGLPALARLPRLRSVTLHNLPNVTRRGTVVFPPHVRVDYGE